MWGICSPEGFLFDCDIYCGKDSTVQCDKLSILNKCALGSRVVLQMAFKLLSSTSPLKLQNYHLYFDNFFTKPDLLVHLKKTGSASNRNGKD